MDYFKTEQKCTKWKDLNILLFVKDVFMALKADVCDKNYEWQWWWEENKEKSWLEHNDVRNPVTES